MSLSWLGRRVPIGDGKSLATAASAAPAAARKEARDTVPFVANFSNAASSELSPARAHAVGLSISSNRDAQFSIGCHNSSYSCRAIHVECLRNLPHLSALSSTHAAALYACLVRRTRRGLARTHNNTLRGSRSDPDPCVIFSIKEEPLARLRLLQMSRARWARCRSRRR